MWNLVKIAQAVSEKKIFKKNYKILHLYIATGAMADNPTGQNFDYN